MAYIDVLPLATVKEYLRIDDTLTDDDVQLTRMIGSALSYIEKWTNIYVYSRTKSYYTPTNGCIRVYDYPINTLDSSFTTVEVEDKGLYKTYSPTTSDYTLSLDIGYSDPADVPQELIDVALEIIDLMYYKNSAAKDISPLSIDVLNQNKRFIL
jgi:hypothetical protein